MIQEIIKKYDYFSDAQIKNVSYTYPTGQGANVAVQIECCNTQNDYDWELINIVFNDITFVRFIGYGDSIGSVIDMAFIKIEEDEIVFDFFGLFDADNQTLGENPESDFIIRCKKVDYQVIEVYK
ncbi:hypothetical protein QWY99_08180 [Flavobacterium branchiarum]|uniref:Uncharacterized protein n=1 Tax=Flavobacterium branchiarum TaxID=1114870 RepID=A0ABV5FS14_9FLAO|nr:hypothetical protein [Flavobacterium branchiarum]MDN3673027.1 hypothetical protein [Flavobacterium branchiarum]